jgi:RNA polymerase sigma-70 factor (ECF subfamily)
MASGSEEPSAAGVNPNVERACGEPDPRDSGRLDSETIESLYRQHAAELRRFLVGVLRDEALAADAGQAAFVKVMELGHTAREESRKAWLFRVAYHEALAIRRREATANRILAGLGRSVVTRDPTSLVSKEQIERVRRAIGNLPLEQQTVVGKRIYEEKTFAQVAEELNIPLGTALTRMRTALAVLRRALSSSDE